MFTLKMPTILAIVDQFSVQIKWIQIIFNILAYKYKKTSYIIRQIEGYTNVHIDCTYKNTIQLIVRQKHLDFYFYLNK